MEAAAPRPALSNPDLLWVSTARIAYDLLQTTGGAAYLPRQMVETALQTRQLHLVSEAMPIVLRLYAAYPTWCKQQELVEQVLKTIRGYL